MASQNIQNNAKLQKWSNYNELLLFDVKTFETTQNYKLIKLRFGIVWDQNNPKCWDTSRNIQNNANQRNWSNYSALHRFDVKTIKMFSDVAKYSKQRKTTKLIKLQWIASIWCQNDQNNSKLQTRSNYDQFASFDIKTIQNVEIRRETFKTTETNEIDQIIMHCIDLTSKRSKLLSYVAKLQNDQIIVHCIDLTSKR